jgi:WS/DGAT/MGAT family acyltransferase
MSAADVSFLYRETRTSPQHVGGIAIFAPPAAGLDYDRLVQLLEERISLTPRYRQKVRAVPGHLAYPVWIDDPNFDITYHVRRSALPRPGSNAQLLEFAARIQSRMLDRSRPLWEMYLVEGLADDRVAIVTKTHDAMVDGIGALDIVQVILDAVPEPRRTVEALWMPDPEPSAKALVVGAMTSAVRSPVAVLDAARLGVQDARVALDRVSTLVDGAVSSAVATVRRRPPGPLAAKLGEQRRIAIARTRLEDYRVVRQAHGGTINDVVLATVTGALRAWLVERDFDVTPALTIRALVPVSVTDGPHDAVGGRVSALLVDLPVGEADPVNRLAHVGFALGAHAASGRSVSADSLASLNGFAPATLHALGARAANGLPRRPFNLVVTNVPGPQRPLYAAGAPMTQMYPIVPLNPGQPLSIGLTSYDGGVYFGINADRDAVGDVGVIGAALESSLADLVALSTGPLAPGPHPSTGVPRTHAGRRTVLRSGRSDRGPRS